MKWEDYVKECIANTDHASCKKYFDSAVEFIRNYTENAGIDHLVVGLSGGIDSAVVASMAAAAGVGDVYLVNMPSGPSSIQVRNRAGELAANLQQTFHNVNYYTVPINRVVDSVEYIIPPAIPNKSHTTLENLQSRLRSVVLMRVANAVNGIVLNTGNASEDLQNYYTLYGDSIGAFTPIGYLTKGEVVALAAWISANYQGCIPQDIITGVPTAELSFGQEDERELGRPYSLIDTAIYNLLLEDPTAIGPVDLWERVFLIEHEVYTNLQQEFTVEEQTQTEEYLANLYANSGWKRQQAAPPLLITGRS